MTTSTPPIAAPPVVPARRVRQFNRSTVSTIVWVVLMIAIVAVVLYPLGWMLSASFKPNSEFGSNQGFWPQDPTIDNYIKVLSGVAGIPLATFFLNSLLLAIGAVIGTVASSSMAAYAFARLDFRGKRFWWLFCITTMFIPGMAVLLTSFLVVAQLGMLNTFAVLVIPGAASAAQMFFFRQFYLGFPMAIEDAALLDGATRWQILLRVFLPQSYAPLVVMGLASYLAYWNAYVWPILTISDPNLVQIMQLLGNFRSERGTDWALLMAGSTIAALPTVFLMLIFQRFIVNGVRIAGLK